MRRSARARSRLVLRLLLAVGLAGLVAVALVVVGWVRELPDYRGLAELRLKATSRVFARGGEAVGTVVPVEGGGRVSRVPVRLANVSPLAVAAVVGSEDRHFYEHHGVDLPGLARSVVSTLRGHRQGGSTLTAQFVRSTILDSEDTLERKVKELVLSVQVDRFLTKDEILTGYLNSVFWGGNLSGIGAAARSYLGKRPSELTLAEGVYLAALLPAPNARFRDFRFVRGELMRSRLERLVEDGRVTRAQADAAWLEPLQPRGWRVRYDDQGKVLEATLLDRHVAQVRDTTADLAPHFMLEVRRFLQGALPEGVLEAGGLKIYTTLDLAAQRAMNEAARGARLPPGAGAQLAAAAVEPASGEVLALFGGFENEDGEPGEFNRATQSRRSPGSSVKPFLYAAALEGGREQWDTLEDAPLAHPDPSQPGGVWRPKNFDGTALGRPVTMRYALDHSLNLPAVRLGLELGLPAYRDTLRALGLENVPDELNLASTLGGGVGASPLQMASAYASFAGGGERVAPSFVRRVEDAAGRVVYERPRPERRRVWSPEVAYLGLDMLLGVVNDPAPFGAGYASPARLRGREVGGKTGTSSDQRDLWFVGVTPGFSAAVWIGRDDNKAMAENVYSGTYAPPVWRTLATGGLENRPSGGFPVPADVGRRWVRGVAMAYRRPPPAPAPAEPVAPIEPVQPVESEPSPPVAEVPPPPAEAGIEVRLDTCSSPPVLADETTDPSCVEVRRVPAEELPLYGRPPEPLPAAPPAEAPTEETPPQVPLEEVAPEVAVPEAAPPEAPPLEVPLPQADPLENVPEPVAPEEPPADAVPLENTPQQEAPAAEETPEPEVPVSPVEEPAEPVDGEVGGP